jgi:hypothetical protein
MLNVNQHATTVEVADLQVLRELLNSLEVVVNGGRGVVAPLEFPPASLV